MLGQIFNQFILAAAKDEAQSSPNYLYILFETTALTLRYLKSNPESFQQAEICLQESLHLIIQTNVTDMISYAFQIYALFIANSQECKENFKAITVSVLQNKNNWQIDMKYMAPALSGMIIAMIYKYPDFMQQFQADIVFIIQHLMSVEIRMEPIGLQVGSAMFEKMGITSEDFLKTFLFSCFKTLHFYRNNTKAKIIPVPISKAIFTCFANFIIGHGGQKLIESCDVVQKDILWMILKSEGERIKYATSPPRDKKYTIIAYSKLISDYSTTINHEVLVILVQALLELCT